MKKILFITSLLLLTIGFVACSDDENTKPYGQLQDEEQALIKDFIKRNNITVVTTMPKSDAWGENEYYKSSSGLYFHLVKAGDTQNNDTVKTKYKISYRSKIYTLSVPGDTISNWSTVDYAYPDVFMYGDYTSTGTGLQEAAKYMRFVNSHAKIIIPHSLNVSSYLQNVTPIGCEIKITAIN